MAGDRLVSIIRLHGQIRQATKTFRPDQSSLAAGSARRIDTRKDGGSLLQVGHCLGGSIFALRFLRQLHQHNRGPGRHGFRCAARIRFERCH